jgi:hypothetical protein
MNYHGYFNLQTGSLFIPDDGVDGEDLIVVQALEDFCKAQTITFAELLEHYEFAHNYHSETRIYLLEKLLETYFALEWAVYQAQEAQ